MKPLKPLDPAARHALLVAAVCGAVAFVITAWRAGAGDFSAADLGMRAFVSGERAAVLDMPMRLASALASGWVLLPVMGLCSVALWPRQRVVAASLPVIGIGSAATLAALKWVVGRPRPSLRGYGFPSGHVFGVCVFIMIALYLLWLFDVPRRVQRAVTAGGVVFVLIVAYSRVYLNAHWLTDLVGGVFAGGSFALAMILLVDAWLPSRSR